MAFLKVITVFVILIQMFFGDAFNVNVLKSWCQNLLNIEQTIILSCYKRELYVTSKLILKENKLIKPFNLDLNVSLNENIEHTNFATTAIILNVCCDKGLQLVENASNLRYLNKTYQWFISDECSKGINCIFPNYLKYLGPNSQITYANISMKGSQLFSLWDIHSKGVHLKRPLEIKLIGKEQVSCNNEKYFHFYEDIPILQSFQNRRNFHGLTLRGVTVIDKDNINTNVDIESILSIATKDSGVAAFTKYHYLMMNILRYHLNFMVDFRNTRGWAGRMENSQFRIGFLGVIARNEADVGVSGIFNRINRFAEFDIIYQGWKFETAFIYRYTSKLQTHRNYGNFLAPFNEVVWIYIASSMLGMITSLLIIEFIIRRFNQNILKGEVRKTCDKIHIYKKSQKCYTDSKPTVDDLSTNVILLNTWAALCQQSLDVTPKNIPSRMIISTIYLFSLVIYNYYTSSVVGGLLSKKIQGPSTIDELLSSSLKLAFEDIGYYKVLFKEQKSVLIARILKGLYATRYNLPIYMNLEKAIPLIRNGSVAFHCELVDAYPIIAKHFDVNQICDLRVVYGLMESEVMNMVLDKNSQYTELFRIRFKKFIIILLPFLFICSILCVRNVLLSMKDTK